MTWNLADLEMATQKFAPSQGSVRDNSRHLLARAEQHDSSGIGARLVSGEDFVMLDAQQFENIRHQRTGYHAGSISSNVVIVISNGDPGSCSIQCASRPFEKISRPAMRKVLAFQTDLLQGTIPEPFERVGGGFERNRKRMGRLHHCH